MVNNPEAYLIQGFYFQRREFLGLAVKPLEGTVAVIREGMFHCMFAGLIWREPNALSWSWRGSMDDSEGLSDLDSIRIEVDELHFDKRYRRRADTIHYEFRLEEDLWVGSFSGDAVGRGVPVAFSHLLRRHSWRSSSHSPHTWPRSPACMGAFAIII